MLIKLHQTIILCDVPPVGGGRSWDGMMQEDPTEFFTQFLNTFMPSELPEKKENRLPGKHYDSTARKLFMGTGCFESKCKSRECSKVRNILYRVLTNI